MKEVIETKGKIDAAAIEVQYGEDNFVRGYRTEKTEFEGLDPLCKTTSFVVIEVEDPLLGFRDAGFLYITESMCDWRFIQIDLRLMEIETKEDFLIKYPDFKKLFRYLYPGQSEISKVSKGYNPENMGWTKLGYAKDSDGETSIWCKKEEFVMLKHCDDNRLDFLRYISKGEALQALEIPKLSGKIKKEVS